MNFYVRLENITKRYGEVYAARDISLDIFEHEFVTLLGPSGSGKTTILMVIAGFIEADSGKVYIAGKDMTNIPPYRRNIGIVFQNYALFPHMTVFENVAYPLKMRRYSRNETRIKVDEILEIVKLESFGTRLPSELSGGQKQRVALARALVFDPPILLMDEPLGALDKKLREHMQLEIKHIQERLGITVLYVTHDQEEALTMSSRIAVVENARIVQLGTADEIYENPCDQFVADFVGETNLFRAEVLHTKDTVVHLTCKYIPRIRVKSEKRMVSGQQVHLSVRPEHIHFLEGAGKEEDWLEGIIKDVVYLGESIKYYVTLLEHRENQEKEVIVMRVQNRFGSPKHSRGEKVKIGWSINDATVV